MVKRQYASKNINRKVLIVNNNQNPLVNEIRNNNHSGYEVVCEIDNFNYEKILDLKPDTVIIGSIESENLPHIYALTKSDIYTSTISLFYEQAFQKIPTEVSTEESIVEYTNKANNIFTTLKRFIDITISILFLIVLSPIIVVVSILVKVSSRGPVLFCQTRVGLNDNLFTIYKFRSMYIDSEKDGPVWTKDDKTDSRITPLGRILRKTHLDEIPQLINIFRGDISFVGPRPERPEFTKIIEEKIPYYTLRHNVKPGLTGWAQINYRYGASVADANEKLKYDFYYIKNKNTFLDILIIAKTFAMILKKH
jgi:exopolysaccharide biosynthesis polyprenyl glycosylphosphotransferase